MRLNLLREIRSVQIMTAIATVRLLGKNAILAESAKRTLKKSLIFGTVDTMRKEVNRLGSAVLTAFRVTFGALSFTVRHTRNLISKAYSKITHPISEILNIFGDRGWYVKFLASMLKNPAAMFALGFFSHMLFSMVFDKASDMFHIYVGDPASELAKTAV